MVWGVGALDQATEFALRTNCNLAGGQMLQDRSRRSPAVILTSVFWQSVAAGFCEQRSGGAGGESLGGIIRRFEKGFAATDGHGFSRIQK